MIIKILGLAALGFLLVNAEPAILLRRFIGFKEEEYNDYGVVKSFFYRMITCSMCLSFWIGLIVTQDIYQAAIISVLAMIIEKIK
jgi:hypothetical protein